MGVSGLVADSPRPFGLSSSGLIKRCAVVKLQRTAPEEGKTSGAGRASAWEKKKRWMRKAARRLIEAAGWFRAQWRRPLLLRLSDPFSPTAGERPGF
ncbi:hypothetical protein V8C34DRAFT_132251 [Trichoderma compactum]